MELKEADRMISRFITSIRFYWQSIFLISVLAYGSSFIYRLKEQTTLRDLSYRVSLNWISFVIALLLAITIFQIKRKYLSLRFFRQYIEKVYQENREFQGKQLARRFVLFIGKKLKTVWYLGMALILLGVGYYWWTFDAWNMHVYFIVGLYSLAINYPRKNLFQDVPYLIQETIPSADQE